MFIAWQTAAFVPGALTGKLQDFELIMARFGWNDKTSLRLKGAMIADHFGLAIKPISEAAKQALLRLRDRG